LGGPVATGRVLCDDILVFFAREYSKGWATP
jgi:hypothetical protein